MSWPRHTRRVLRKGGEPFPRVDRGLRCGPFKVQQLAEEFGTPLFLYSADHIRERYGADQSAARFLRTILKYPPLLNRVFRNMREDAKLAELFALIYLDERPTKMLLTPVNLLRLVL